MRVVKTTDGRNISVNIEVLPSKGQSVMLGDFEFVVQSIDHLDNKNVLLSNPNYQIELEE